MPQSRTMRVASCVAPARSLAAPGGRLPQYQDLGGPAAQAHGQRVVKIALLVKVAFGNGQLLGDAERLAGGQDGDLGYRVGVRAQRGHQAVTGLVDGHRVLLVGEQGVGGVPPAQQDAVAGGVEVGRGQEPRSWRTATMAASLTRLARSAPANPGCPGR